MNNDFKEFIELVFESDNKSLLEKLRHLNSFAFVQAVVHGDSNFSIENYLLIDFIFQVRLDCLALECDISEFLRRLHENYS